MRKKTMALLCAACLSTLSILSVLSACGNKVTTETKRQDRISISKDGAAEQMNNGEKRYEAQFLQLFDTLTTIVAFSSSEDAFQADVQKLKDELKTYHELYDIYNNYPGLTNLKTINDQAGRGPLQVDPKIIDLLRFGQEAYTFSQGKVNIALGAVLRIWHEHREEGLLNPETASLPSSAELEKANQHCNISDMLIDSAASTVELKDPEMSLDVGAIAKGYATEKISAYVQKLGFSNILFSVGGNVRALGYRDAQAERWRVGIQNPDDASPGAYVQILNLQDASMVTSGIYERYYRVDGKSYHHIIDPLTLFPGDRYKSVTIITHDSGLADALSTAVFNMDIESGKKLIESFENTEAFWILSDNTHQMTDGYEALVIK